MGTADRRKRMVEVMHVLLAIGVFLLLILNPRGFLAVWSFGLALLGLIVAAFIGY